MNVIQDKLDLLIELFPDYIFENRHNEVFTYCPQCSHHKKKLVINLEKNLFHCWVCNYGGRVPKLLRTYAGESLARRWNFLDNSNENLEGDLRDLLEDRQELMKAEKVSLPPEARKLRNNIPSLIAQKALQYLMSRNVSYRIVRTYNFYFCEEGKYRDRVILPSYDINGRVNFFVARSIYDSPDIEKYIAPTAKKQDIIFNELFITWEKPVVLVEGPFDAIGVNRNAVPLLGTSLAEDSEIFKKICNYRPEVVLMLDNDEPGKVGTTKAGKLLTDWGINTSIAVYDKKDPSDLTKKEVFEALKHRKPFTSSDVLRRILE